jgi:hypothetical protein
MAYYMEERGTKLSFLKRILVVDDDPDLTLTFKIGLEGYHDNEKRFDHILFPFKCDSIYLLDGTCNLYVIFYINKLNLMKCACCGSEMLPHEEIGKAIVFKCKECGLSNSIPNETLDQ